MTVIAAAPAVDSRPTASSPATVAEQDRRLLAEIQDGIPVTPRPFADIGGRIGLSGAEVISRLESLIERGIVKRFGLIVRHHELGYAANAMVVWDIPDEAVAEAAHRIAGYPFVTLCYRRPRRSPRWPYNLFCMIHGRDRDTVRAQVAKLRRETGLAGVEHAVLFSVRRFKQCGARFATAPSAETA